MTSEKKYSYEAKITIYVEGTFRDDGETDLTEQARDIAEEERGVCPHEIVETEVFNIKEKL